MMLAHGMPRMSATAGTRNLRNSRDGTVAVTFALLLLPVLAAIGVGVDAARAYSAKMRFDAAFNNAALSLRASAASETAATLQARMQSYLDLATPSSASGGHVTLRMSDPLQPVVMVTASTAVPTTLMQLAGVRSFPLHAAAQVVRQHPPASQATPGDGGDDNRGTWEEQRQDTQRGVRHDLWLR
jgi:Flp pilus assembly protein TadG